MSEKINQLIVSVLTVIVASFVSAFVAIQIAKYQIDKQIEIKKKEFQIMGREFDVIDKLIKDKQDIDQKINLISNNILGILTGRNEGNLKLLRAKASQLKERKIRIIEEIKYRRK